MKPYGIQIRRATVQDAAIVHEITIEAFTQYSKNLGIPVAALHESVADVAADIKQKIVFLALQDGVPMGVMRLEPKHGWGYFSRFGVKKTTRGNGLGAALIDAATDWARQEGLQGLILHTSSKMLSLVRFYYTHGFFIDSTDKSRGYIRALLVKPVAEGAQANPEDWL